MAFLPLENRLLQAATDGDISLIRKLFHNKTKTETVVDDDGNTPLMLAVLNNHLAATKLLLEHGANIEHANNLQHRSVHFATMNECEEMLILLLSKGAQFKVPNHEGFLPIQISHAGSNVHRILFNAHNGIIPVERKQVDDVPVIPTYSIPAAKVKTVKGKKDKKKGGKTKKRGEKIKYK